MLDPFDMVEEVAKATTAVTTEITQHEALKNTPALQAAAVYQRLQDVLDKHRELINDEDLAAVRQFLAAPDALPGTPTPPNPT